MAELPESPLPREPEYWEELAHRIREDASGPLLAYAAAGDVWYGVLARRAPWWVAAASAAILLLALSLPRPEPSVALRWIERSLAPDELAGTLIAGPAPPSVDALLVQFPPAPEDRPDPRDPERQR